MDSTTFLTLAALAVAALLGLALAARPRRREEAAVETTRWRRFLLRHTVLHEGSGEARAAVEEVRGSLRLVLEPGDLRGRRPLQVSGPGGARFLEARRAGWLPGARRWLVSLRGEPWLEALLPHGKRPRAEIAFLAPGARLDLQGSLAAREFTLWREGVLVATVSWQLESGEVAGMRPDHYFVEVLKSEDPLPPLALVLVLEALEPAPAPSGAPS